VVIWSLLAQHAYVKGKALPLGPGSADSEHPKGIQEEDQNHGSQKLYLRIASRFPCLLYNDRDSYFLDASFYLQPLM